jgi:predicted SprT family Zn-dependent metalloprotease
VLNFSPQLLRCDLVFVNQIILHEVAHALTGPVGHGSQWLKMARALGYELNAKVPYDYPLARGFKYVLMCENLTHSSLRKEKTYESGARNCALCHDAGAGAVPMLWEAL